MAKVKQPLLSLDARRKLGDDIVFKKQGRTAIVESRPIPADARSPGQLSWRHMFQKVVALWHALNATEKESWESAARSRHMTGYAWFVSQALRPNPGIYLPLQGGIMQGIIDMDGYAIQDLLDPVNPQDADTEAARDAAIAAAIAGSLHCDIYAWDGANWQELRVESAAQHNLRVKLFDGANGIDSYLFGDGAVALTDRGLPVIAAQMALDTTLGDFEVTRTSRSIGDNDQGINTTPVTLMGWKGARYARLRVYDSGILKVGRAEIGLSTLRRVGAGAVKGSAGTLYWMTMNPTAANSVIELTDDLDGSTAVVWEMTHGANAAHHMNLDPPMEFSTGIWLKTLTNFTSVIFGYK